MWDDFISQSSADDVQPMIEVTSRYFPPILHIFRAKQHISSFEETPHYTHVHINRRPCVENRLSPWHNGGSVLLFQLMIADAVGGGLNQNRWQFAKNARISNPNWWNIFETLGVCKHWYMGCSGIEMNPWTRNLNYKYGAATWSAIKTQTMKRQCLCPLKTKGVGRVMLKGTLTLQGGKNSEASPTRKCTKTFHLLTPIQLRRAQLYFAETLGMPVHVLMQLSLSLLAMLKYTWEELPELEFRNRFTWTDVAILPSVLK